MIKKKTGRKRRHGRIRKKLFGTTERPRLSVHRSLKHIHVQCIDDTSSTTLSAASTAAKEFAGKGSKASKTAQAEKLGEFVAKKLKDKGIAKIAFDRSGYRYHGRIKALADSMRKAGINF